MDPRNFLNEVRVFQFEALSYDEKTNNIDGIEKILYGTEFYNRIVDYVTSSGNVITMNSKYSDLILSAGKTSKVSTYHLASRIKQEVGPFLSHSSISGRVAGFEGLYNFYNIGATSSAEPMGAIKNGLRYARDGKGASEATKAKYLIPWDNKEKSIRSIYNGYNNTGILGNSMTFIIPVYNNMPQMSTQNPNILESDYSEDNTKVYADVTNTLNVRSGPSTSYELLTKVDRNVVMTRIAKGRQSRRIMG